MRTAIFLLFCSTLAGCGGLDSLSGSSGMDSLGGSSGFDSLSGSSGFGGDGSGTPSAPLDFRAQLQRSNEDRHEFTVRARAGGATVGQVRESVRFQATRYCLPTFGKSDAEWTIDPDTGDWAFVRDGADMIFSGRCTAR
ncbi:MAG: hypothetical protein ACR2O1_06945 [Boseongicola sp.]